MIRKCYHISIEELGSDSFSVTYKTTKNYKNVAVRIIDKEDKEEEFLNKLVPRIVKILRAFDNRHTNIIQQWISSRPQNVFSYSWNWPQMELFLNFWTEVKT
jgi:hypothetical protein